MKCIIMLGLPGSGKGTQSRLLSEKYTLETISSGDMLRRAVADDSNKNKDAMKAMLQKGQLLDDELVLKLVSSHMFNTIEVDYLYRSGFIFDGVPRNVNQARLLDIALEELSGKFGVAFSINAIIHLRADEGDIIDRLKQRMICNTCSAVYNRITHPPRREGVCDICHGTELVNRDDDKRDVVVSRMITLKPLIKDLCDYYAAKQVSVINVDATADADDILEAISFGIDKICSNYA